MRTRGNFDAVLPEPECLPSTKPKIKTRLELESQNFFRCEGYIMQKDPVLKPFFIPYHKWPGLKSFHSKSVLPGLPHTNPSVSNSERLGPAPNQRERFESCLLSACWWTLQSSFSFVKSLCNGTGFYIGQRALAWQKVFLTSLLSQARWFYSMNDWFHCLIFHWWSPNAQYFLSMIVLSVLIDVCLWYFVRILKEHLRLAIASLWFAFLCKSIEKSIKCRSVLSNSIASGHVSIQN